MKEAEAAYREAVAIRAAVAADRPDDPGDRHNLALTRVKLGICLRDTGGLPEAERLFGLAVADAYDAMSSDRPYRKGMEDAKLDAIFRAGSGKQWDPDVVEAFFRCRDDIRTISLREPDPIDAVSLDWTH